jgi:hypothetical protein
LERETPWGEFVERISNGCNGLIMEPLLSYEVEAGHSASRLATPCCILPPAPPPASTLGWVDIGTGTKVHLRFVTHLSKVTKINGKTVLIQWPLHRWSNHFGSCTTAIKRSKHFCSQYGLHGYQQMQNFTWISTKFSDKMHLKKIFQDTDFHQYTGGPLCSKEIIFSWITFLGAFCR